MDLRAWTRQLEQTLHTMPSRSRVWLVLAIFLTFSSLTLWSDTSPATSGSWIYVASWAWLSGFIGVGYALVAFGYRRLLPAVIAFTVLGPAMLYGSMPSKGGVRALSLEPVQLLQRRLEVFAFVRTATTLLAYGSFLALLRTEGRRSIGAYTEIRLARQIHAGLVPPTTGRADAFEWFGVSHPSGDVGGDLVDVVSPSGQHWTACVADVSGHGVAAGVLMGMFKTALHSACRVTVDPAETLTQINEVLTPLRQSNMFVTAALISGGEGHRLDYVLAGHPPLAHVAAVSGEASWVGESQIAVGFIDAHRYTATPLHVSRGDLIVIVTDGLIEVFDHGDRELGQDGLLRIIQAAARHDSLAETAREIFAASARFGRQADDQSLLIVRRTSP